MNFLCPQLSLFRRLSYSRLKQSSTRDQTPAEVAVRGGADVQGEPPHSGAAAESSNQETNRSRAQQKSAPSEARGPRSGACTVL